VIPPRRRHRLAAADDDAEFPVVAFGVGDAAVRVVQGAATVVTFAGAPLAYRCGKTIEIRSRVRRGNAKRQDNDDGEKGQPHRALHVLRPTLTPRTPP